MREFSVDEELNKKLSKLLKRDKSTYAALMNKINEVLTCENIDHYKNLRNPL